MKSWSTATWLAVGLVGVHVVLGLLLYEPVLYTGGDNAGYMILGDALRSGAGYRDLYRPDLPLHTKYPPGLPALLAAVGLFGGLQAFKLFSLACSAATVGLTYLLGRGLVGPRLGVAAAAVVAVDPLLLQYSHWVLSESLFTAVVMAALWLHVAAEREGGAEKGAPSERRWEPAWWSGLAASVGAFLVRVAGAPLLLADLATRLVRRQWRRAAIVAGTAVATLGGWRLYQALAGGRPGYMGELMRVHPNDPSAGTVGLLGLVERGVHQLWYHVSVSFPTTVLGETVERGSDAVGVAVLGVALTVLALTGWGRRVADGMGVPEWFTVLYVGLISVWWADPRFLAPLFPLLAVYVVLGAKTAAHALPLGLGPGRAWLAGAGTAALLVLPGLISAGKLVPFRTECMAGYRAGDPCLPDRWISFHAAADWARRELPEEAVLANRKPRIFYWLSERRGDVYAFSRDHDVVIDGLVGMGADYVVVDPLSRSAGSYLVPAVRARSAHFRAVYSEGDPPTTVLAFEEEPRPRGGPAH